MTSMSMTGLKVLMFACSMLIGLLIGTLRHMIIYLMAFGGLGGAAEEYIEKHEHRQVHWPNTLWHYL